VTSASTPLGAQTCRTLLRHNALVLGIDSDPVTEKQHRLFSALGTHFQTLQLELEDEDAVPRMVEHSKERFWKEGFDILVTFGEGEGSIKLRSEIAGIMAQTGDGVVLNVLDEGSVGQSQDIVRLAGESGKTGVRASVVLIDGFAAGQEGWTMLEAPVGGIPEVKECTDRFRALEGEDTDTEKGDQGIADLLLYLSTAELGGKISGAVVTADGGRKPL
jgi:hypothetical protein